MRSRRAASFSVFARIACVSTAVCMPISAYAVQSTFEYLVQGSPGPIEEIPDNRFNRQEHAGAGSKIVLFPWEWDSEAKEWVYAVEPGETWSWYWRDKASDQIIGTHTLTFEGGDNHCWSNGQCKTAGELWAMLPMQCMPEGDRVTVETYHNGDFLGSDWYRPTRFHPTIAQTFLPESLEPKRYKHQEGQSGDVAALVKDDLGCEVSIEEAEVKLTSTVDDDTNGQEYMDDGDVGTGRFSSLGFDSVLNPGTRNTDGTVIKGDTDSNGIFKARYHAENHGAEEDITFDVRRPATAEDPEVIGESVEEEIRLEIPGLVRITKENGPLGFRDGGGCPHNPKPHWLMPNTRTRLLALVAIYNVKTGRNLSLNDGSLPMGGVIANKVGDDGNGGGRDAHCHTSHRQGFDIDINRVDMGDHDMATEMVGPLDDRVTLLKDMQRTVRKIGGQIHNSFDEEGRLKSIHWRLN